MDISVVVPFYNAERYIQDCITALLSQSYPADCYEVIMVDNNSTDRSVEIVQQHPRIKCLAECKQGAYAARNRGLSEAQGEIIAFTDPDCVPTPDWLQNMTTAMLHPEVSIVLGSRQFASGSPGLSMLAAYESEKAAYVYSRNIKETCYGYTNNMGVRKSLFDRLGPFMEITRGADTVFVRRAVDEYSCDIVCYAPIVQVRHLEINSVQDFYRKHTIRGRSNQDIHSIAAFRPLNTAERLQIFKKTAQRNQYPLVKSVFLFLLLCTGGLCYEFGRWDAIWNLKRRGKPAWRPQG